MQDGKEHSIATSSNYIFGIRPLPPSHLFGILSLPRTSALYRVLDLASFFLLPRRLFVAEGITKHETFAVEDHGRPMK